MAKIVVKKTLKVIPAKKKTEINQPKEEQTVKIRMAAYCRVSTAEEEQQYSFRRQQEYYKKTCKENGWDLVEVYADDAKSGTGVKWRDGFNAMIEDAKAGKFDYIITKSVSRFGRNTVDTIDYVRILKSLTPPVGVVFEEEAMNTMEIDNEITLTIMSAIAQDESEAMSESISFGIIAKFRKGIAQVNLNRFYGFRPGENHTWLVFEPEADVVRWMYEKYCEGYSARKIATLLNEAGHKTSHGRPWSASTVMGTLRNEAYVGDCKMQKTYTKNCLDHISEINRGEKEMYVWENHHPAIVSRKLWNAVQEKIKEMENRRNRKKSNEPDNSD